MPQPRFIIRNSEEIRKDDQLPPGRHVHYLNADHLYEPLYEIVATLDAAATDVVPARYVDRYSDRLWELREPDTGRIVYTDLTKGGWRTAEEVAVDGPGPALWLAARFGHSAHESGMPPIPEHDANYVTAVTLWPKITDELTNAWLGYWFDADEDNPMMWDYADWSEELEGSRYAEMSPEQALTALAVDLEVAVKAALPRYKLPIHVGVQRFLDFESRGGPRPGFDSVRGVMRGVDAAEQPQSSIVLETASGPLTAPAAVLPAAATHDRPAPEFPRATPPQQRDEPRRRH